MIKKLLEIISERQIMFSGIIEGLEKPVKINKDKQTMILTLPIPKGWNLNEGDSINVDGVCSTINHLGNSSFSIYYMPETLSKTTMGNLNTDHFFNLERSLNLNSLVGGHLVLGHADTTAILKSIKSQQDSKVLKFKISSQFTKYIIYKGSITINGVSLTIVLVNKKSFIVSLIPYTLKHTNLGNLRVGDKVNIEVDLMAKYLEKFISPYLKNLNKK